MIIINETMAKQLFANGENPLGQKLVTGMLGLTGEIVGVVADTHTHEPHARRLSRRCSIPVFQRPENFTGILVRTDGDPAALAASVRAALHDVDPGIPLDRPDTMQRSRRAVDGRPRPHDDAARRVRRALRSCSRASASTA